MDVNVIVKPIQGESLYSLVARLARVNGYKPDLACKILLGEEYTPRVADAKVHLPTLLNATHGLYGNQKKYCKNLLT